MSVSVLLVEDNEPNLQAKKAYLGTFDCGPILGVHDPDTAIHVVRSLPHFDLVVADIDLSEASKKCNQHNKGGVAVARWLKETKYPAFVAGYSSYFEGDEISENERSVFDDIVDRSVGGSALNEKMQAWIERASGADRTSTLSALLLEAYQKTTPQSRSKRVPLVSLETLVDYETEEVSEIRRSGYSLSLLLPDVDDEIHRAIPIWIKRESGAHYIEVVGQPYLFAEGANEHEAKDALKVLILGYYEDLIEKDPKEEMGPYVKMLFSFLDSLFK